jgi:hypothetical protein
MRRLKIDGSELNLIDGFPKESLEEELEQAREKEAKNKTNDLITSPTLFQQLRDSECGGGGRRSMELFVDLLRPTSNFQP